MTEVTQILDAMGRGDQQASERLLPILYQDLRRLAANLLAREPVGQTLEATALVHEAYVRVVDAADEPTWKHRGHFFAAAAEAMRRILVDRARRNQAGVHGGGRVRVDLHKVEAVGDLSPDRLLALDEALTLLAQHDPVAGRLVHLRYFAGLSVEEAAEAAGLSRATGYRHWAFARAWLVARLTDGESEQSASI